MRNTIRTLLVNPHASMLWMPYGPASAYVAVTPDRGPGLAKDFDLVVLMTGTPGRDFYCPEYLEHPNCVYFNWDPMSAAATAPGPELLAFIKENYRAYSFQREDCGRYGLRYAPAPYYPLALPPAERKGDIVFLGRPKGRYERLQFLRGMARSEGVSTYIRLAITGEDIGVYPEEFWPGWVASREQVHYLDYLRWLAGAKAVVDFTQPGQSAGSQRENEFLLYGHLKLITDNEAVLEEDWYSPENVFIVGRDEGLKAWLEIPRVPIDPAILDARNVAGGWARNIYEDGV